jgi:hypothetical protein
MRSNVVNSGPRAARAVVVGMTVGIAAFASRAAMRASRAEVKPRARAVSLARAAMAAVSEARDDAMLSFVSDMFYRFLFNVITQAQIT